MGFRFSLNFFLAKVRTTYALRIKPAEYEQMLSCKNLKELLKILKEKKFYSDVFKSIQENCESTGVFYLERALDHKFLDVLESVSRYDKLLGGSLRAYISSYVDVKFIMNAFERVLKLKSGKKLLYEGSNWVFECKNLKLQALSFAKKFEEFFAILQESDYKKLFKDISLKDEHDEHYVQSVIQKRLYENLYDKLLTGICGVKNIKSKKELFSIFSCYLELRSFVFGIRAKRFSDRPMDLLPDFKSFEQKVLSKLENLNLESDYYELLNSSYLASQIEGITYCYPEQLPEKFLLLRCRKSMHFSSDPTVVVLSFINLLKTEIQNIIKIVEGVRCGILGSKIREVLVV